MGDAEGKDDEEELAAADEDDEDESTDEGAERVCEVV